MTRLIVALAHITIDGWALLERTGPVLKNDFS